MQIFSPLKPFENINLNLNDKLAASAQNYQGPDLGETVDNYFVVVLIIKILY